MEKTINDIVEVFPNQILFDLSQPIKSNSIKGVEYVLKSNITISNLKDEYILFIIQTNQKGYYSVDPSISIILPKEKKDISITRYCFDGLQIIPDKEKFLIKIYAYKEMPKEEDKNSLKSKISEEIPTQIIKMKTGQINKNNIEYIGLNLVKLGPIYSDPKLLTYKFDLLNLLDNYIIFEIFENCKGIKYISERRYICPKEKINCIIQKNYKTKQEIEKILIKFYLIDKIINNNDEVFKILNTQSFREDSCQTAIIKINENHILSKETTNENDLLEINKIIIQENEYINDDTLIFNKNNDDFEGVLFIKNLTNNYYICKIFNNHSKIYVAKPSKLFISPNKIEKFLFKRVNTSNFPFEEGQEKILIIFYTIDKEIHDKDELEKAFKLKTYNLSSKKEILLLATIKNDENQNKLSFNINNDNGITHGDLINKINNDNELEKEKEKNKILEERLNELNNKIIEYKQIIEKNQDDIKIYQDNSYESLINKILEKDNENKILQAKLKRYPFELNEGEEILCINFCSRDKKIQNYSAICKNTDKFNIIENKLYKDYPEFYETENHFICKGNKINKNKSLEENNIHNNDVIIMF